MDSNPMLGRFLFDPQSPKDVDRDVQLKIDALEERIATIVRRVDVKGVPIVGHILQLTHDPEELNLISKAISRVADLVPELEDLTQKKQVIDLIRSDPHFLAATFGHFDADIDAFIGENRGDQ